MPSHAPTTDEAIYGLLRSRRSTDSHHDTSFWNGLGLTLENADTSLNEPGVGAYPVGAESSPLESEEEKVDDFHFQPMDRAQAYTLYACHLLSTWNARTYEFAAVLFTAAAYPAGFTASSILGIIGSLSVVLFAPSLGRWIDRSPSRLRPLLTTITFNRCTILAACACWLFIVGGGVGGASPNGDKGVAHANAAPDPPPPRAEPFWKPAIFALIVALGTVEKLSRMANVLAMERDWVPTLAPPQHETGGASEPFGLTRVNAVMSRIDLLCKLVAPIVVSGVISVLGSTRWGVCVVAGMGAVSWGAEVWTARRVWMGSAALRGPKAWVVSLGGVHGRDQEEELVVKPRPGSSRMCGKGLLSLLDLHRGISILRAWVSDQLQGFRAYFATTVWAPSIAMSVLHVSSLSYTATLIVYLLGTGFDLNAITVAKIGAAVAGLGSTWVLTLGVRVLAGKRRGGGKGKGREEARESESEVELLPLGEEQDAQANARSEKSAENSGSETEIIRLGAAGFGGMVLCLTPVVLSIWTLPTAATKTSPLQTHPFPALLLLVFLSLSSLARELLALTTTQLSQTRVPPKQWSSFAGSEMSFVSLFGLGHWVSAVWFWRIEDFRWLALGSWAAIAAATGLYGGWMAKERWQGRGRDTASIASGSRLSRRLSNQSFD